MVPKRTKSERNRFLQYRLGTVDKDINQMIENKFSRAVFPFYIWVASRAWEIKGGERNPCTYPIFKLASYFQVDRKTIGRWCSHLSEIGKIETKYIVRLPNGKLKPFKNWKAARQCMKKDRGHYQTVHIRVLDRGLCVKQGKNQKKNKGVPE